ncbi:hypothetical protein GCM10007160_36570 [Litchfieldella qijiaojingensis]|uniref:Solute-binding protein family 3/N-terminal domain-containing protein n=1 Tax=Litchfieldella qijiaojingensis TaxID=980347 RepID=A0ABQ2Z604_9GAMM|nr:transporter substrate-binding domain-containing protein [Halomonas qijiaojingensis]GGY05715.1 hypothetical protein GCM10007160_36570 [Halomonas qijiaojingensis]
MKKKTVRIGQRLAPLMVIPLLLLSPFSQAGTLIFNTEEYPPFNFVNSAGNIDGFSTRLLEATLDEANLSATFRLLPWARAYTEAQLREHHCVFSTARTPERESLFQWVGPLVVTDWAAFALTDIDIQASRLSELENLRVGSFRGDAVGRFVENSGVPILVTAADRENISRLEAGLIDVWVSSETVARHIAAEAGVSIERLFTFNQAEMYLACHLSVPETILTRLQTSLDTLRSEGHYERIRERVLRQWEREP